MPKKDTASAIVGMLSTAGAQTRPVAPPEPPTPDRGAEQPTVVQTGRAEESQASVSTLPTPTRTATTAGEAAPRTLRLRTNTAQRLREAWLEAKRDDVLLTAQDFASDLVDDALRRRRRTAQSS